MKTWFITGASTGLGRCIAEAALHRGDRVAAVAIDPQNMEDYPGRFGERVWTSYLDVTDEDMVGRVFCEAVNRFGAIDICVNNAGFMHLGAVEELTGDEVRKVMDTNFTGCFYVSHLAAGHMRRNGRGVIVQMSSLSAVDVLPGNGAYAASKWAMEGMSLALAREMEPFGVRVVMLEPGTIRTGIERRSRHSEPITAYAEVMASDRRRWVDGDESGSTGDPVRCAEVLLEVVDMPEPPLRLPLTTFSFDISRMVMRDRLEQLERWFPLGCRADADVEERKEEIK